MAEQLSANNDPLSRVAKSKLLEAGVQPEPDSLYVLQLMKWGASKSGEVEFQPNLGSRLAENFQVLEGMEPKEALRLLTDPDSDGRTDDPETLQEKSPGYVASELWGMLHSLLTLRLPGYPMPTEG